MQLTPEAQRKMLAQPKKTYVYDGIFGLWLWLPWKFHAIVAILAWPFFLWIFPHLPFGKENFVLIYNKINMWLAFVFFLIGVLSALLSFILEEEGKTIKSHQRKPFMKQFFLTKHKRRQRK